MCVRSRVCCAAAAVADGPLLRRRYLSDPDQSSAGRHSVWSVLSCPVLSCPVPSVVRLSSGTAAVMTGLWGGRSSALVAPADTEPPPPPPPLAPAAPATSLQPRSAALAKCDPRSQNFWTRRRSAPRVLWELSGLFGRWRRPLTPRQFRFR